MRLEQVGNNACTSSTPPTLDHNADVDDELLHALKKKKRKKEKGKRKKKKKKKTN